MPPHPRTRLRILFLPLWILGSALLAQSLPTPPVVAQATIEDGPHVMWNGSKARIFRVHQGHLEQKDVNSPFALPLPGLATEPITLKSDIPLPAQAVFPTPEKILAVSDVHGRLDTLLTLLKAHKVVNEKLQWSFGSGHLVILGDVMDRGPAVTEALWFLRALEKSAQKKGGWVHVLIGNHEAMEASGDIRYLNSKYLTPPAGLPSQAELIGPNSDLGRWLRSRPALLKLGDTLFVHGGISPELVRSGLNLEQINTTLHGAFGLKKGTATGHAALLLGPMGPLWYRGLLESEKAPSSSEADISQALEHFQVKAIVVGHTTLDRITVFHGGKVFAIDAGINKGRSGEIWFWEKGCTWRGTSKGSRERL